MAWNVLAREFGRDRFARFLQGFAAENAYKRITLDDFMAAMRRFAGTRNNVVSQWFETTGVPEVQTTWQLRPGGVRVLADEQSVSEVVSAVP